MRHDISEFVVTAMKAMNCDVSAVTGDTDRTADFAGRIAVPAGQRSE